MPLRTLVLIIIGVALAIFTAVNWSVFTASTNLSLVFTSVQAPLGLVMLGVVVLISLLFLAFVLYLETSGLLAMRRQSRELNLQRELADKAEASRFTELRTYLEEAHQKAGAQRAEDHVAMLARIDQLEEGTKASIEQTGNSLAAQLGELEDRLERYSSERNPSQLR